MIIPLVYHPIYSELDLPEGHRYPINKYRYLYDFLRDEEIHDKRMIASFRYVSPIKAPVSLVQEVHSADYVEQLAGGHLAAAKMRRIGFPWSSQLVERTLTSIGGTEKTLQLAVDHGIAIHLSGGYHHAHFDFGSGFCLWNDLVIAAHSVLKRPDVAKVLIIDSDVHHGDGSASLAAGREDIVTLSFHCDKNFPARKPDSDIDVALPVGTTDEDFLQNFNEQIQLALYLHKPDLILYDAGVDIHVEDELGYFDISTDALYERDKMILSLAKDLAIPIGCVIGGGYRSDHRQLVHLHFQLFRAALEVFG